MWINKVNNFKEKTRGLTHSIALFGSLALATSIGVGQTLWKSAEAAGWGAQWNGFQISPRAYDLSKMSTPQEKQLADETLRSVRVFWVSKLPHHKFTDWPATDYAAFAKELNKRVYFKSKVSKWKHLYELSAEELWILLRNKEYIYNGERLSRWGIIDRLIEDGTLTEIATRIHYNWKMYEKFDEALYTALKKDKVIKPVLYPLEWGMFEALWLWEEENRHNLEVEMASLLIISDMLDLIKHRLLSDALTSKIDIKTWTDTLTESDKRYLAWVWDTTWSMSWNGWAVNIDAIQNDPQAYANYWFDKLRLNMLNPEHKAIAINEIMVLIDIGAIQVDENTRNTVIALFEANSEECRRKKVMLDSVRWVSDQVAPYRPENFHHEGQSYCYQDTRESVSYLLTGDTEWLHTKSDRWANLQTHFIERHLPQIEPIVDQVLQKMIDEPDFAEEVNKAARLILEKMWVEDDYKTTLTLIVRWLHKQMVDDWDKTIEWRTIHATLLKLFNCNLVTEYQAYLWRSVNTSADDFTKDPNDIPDASAYSSNQCIGQVPIYDVIPRNVLDILGKQVGVKTTKPVVVFKRTGKK